MKKKESSCGVGSKRKIKQKKDKESDRKRIKKKYCPN